jgi:mannosyltransferase OCH1-like enzyme
VAELFCWLAVDAFPRAPLEGLTAGHELILPSSDGLIISNHWFAARAHSPFLGYALEQAPRFNVRVWPPYLRVFFSTGPLMLHIVLREYLRREGTQRERVLLLTSDEARRYVGHAAGRSWLGVDGLILNFMADHISTLGLMGAAAMAGWGVRAWKRRRKAPSVLGHLPDRKLVDGGSSPQGKTRRYPVAAK